MKWKRRPIGRICIKLDLNHSDYGIVNSTKKCKTMYYHFEFTVHAQGSHHNSRVGLEDSASVCLTMIYRE